MQQNVGSNDILKAFSYIRFTEAKINQTTTQRRNFLLARVFLAGLSCAFAALLRVYFAGLSRETDPVAEASTFVEYSDFLLFVVFFPQLSWRLS
jgi:hypothetical protein